MHRPLFQWSVSSETGPSHLTSLVKSNGRHLVPVEWMKRWWEARRKKVWKKVSGGGVSWTPGEVYTFLEVQERPSLVARWWTVCLPMQETWVHSLVWEDPHVMEQLIPDITATEPTCPTARALQKEKPLQWETWAPQLERSPARLNYRKVWAAIKTQQSKRKSPEEQLKAPNSRGVPS